MLFGGRLMSDVDTTYALPDNLGGSLEDVPPQGADRVGAPSEGGKGGLEGAPAREAGTQV